MSLRDMLAQVTSTLASVSRRLEVVENGGLDRNPDRPTRGQNNQARPPNTITTSVNPDCNFLSKCLFRKVQLDHHGRNWYQTPKTIQRRVRQFVDDINPPQPDAVLRENLRAAGDEFVHKIRAVVLDHIDRLERQETERIRTLPRIEVDRAADMAKRQLVERYPRAPEDRRRLIEEAVKLVGTGRQPLPGLPPPRPSTTETTAALATSTPSKRKQLTDADGFVTVGSPSAANKKRRPAGTTPPTTSNRFDVLAVPLGQPDVEPIDVDTDLRTVTPVRKSSSPKPHRKVPSTSDVIVHDGPKTLWSLKPEPTTKTIFIGDSNLRLMKNPPPGWEVHCFPGAKFDHMASLLEQLPEDAGQLMKIAVAAGINHREDVDDHYVFDLARIRDFADRRHFTVVVTGVSTDCNLPADQAKKVVEINDNLMTYLIDRYIARLDPASVKIRPGDGHGIHHDETTAAVIFEDVICNIENLGESNSCDLSKNGSG